MRVEVPAIPAAAYRDSISERPGGTIGVSGGGGEPRFAFVVEVEAVEPRRLTEWVGCGAARLDEARALLCEFQYCWGTSGYEFTSVEGFLRCSGMPPVCAPPPGGR